jgi:hypothetical protein
MFQELLAVGVGRVAVTDRSVIVHHDLSGLSAQNTCKALSADALSLALSNARPPGVLLFPVGSMTASPHVCLAARVLTQGVESGECHAAAGQHCVRVDVRGWFTDKGGAPPDCAQKDGVPEPDLVTSVTSRPFSACPDAAVLGDVASEVFAAFALRVGTRDAGVEEAALIQPGCVEMLRVVPKSWAAPLKASATERPPVHLDGAHWAGFSQELAEALTLAGMLGEVTWGTKEPERGLIFSWSEPEASAAGDARKVELTLRWKGAGAPAEAVTLKFSPTERKECRLTSLGYQRTVAARTAMWLLGARFPDMAPAPDPESTSKASDKNWAAAPLGLLLPGLPQVIDGHAERGAVLAAIDTVFLTASLVLVLTSVGERRAVSRGEPDASVHSANQQLAAGLCLGGVAVGTRVVSVLW